MKQLEMKESMWAEMRPCCYGGENCDELEPRWEGYADGDMETDTFDMVQLKSEHFPPGTKVVVTQPCCPEHNTGFYKDENGKWKCLVDECTFDLEEWARDQYS